jgi:hypothetical protein
MNYLNVNIPTFAAYVDEGFFYNSPASNEAPRVLVEVFSFTSIPQRCGMFSVMTEWGTQHARVPIHYLHTCESGGSFYPLDFIQLWDSYSYYVSCSIVEYTKNRKVEILLKDKKVTTAKYLFTLDWCLGPQYNYGYAEMAGGHKCGHVFEGDGQYFIQPNNRVMWMDGGAFISKKLTRPDWKVFSQEFSCENTGSKWVSESDEELFFYQFKEK